MGGGVYTYAKEGVPISSIMKKQERKDDVSRLKRGQRGKKDSFSLP